MKHRYNTVQAQMADHPGLRRHGVHTGPQLLNLSVLSFDCCRCRAIYCPIGCQVAERRDHRRRMEPDLVERVFSDVVRFPAPPVVRFLPHGELAEYDGIDALADVIRPYAPRVPIVANTNGVKLALLEPMLPHLAILEVSMNAVRETEYRRLRPAAIAGDFPRIAEEVSDLARRVRLGRLGLRLVVSFLRYPGVNDSSWEEFARCWSERGAEPVLRELHSFSSHVPLPRADDRSLEGLPPCKSLFTRMTVTSSGNFTRCYNDIYETDVIGRVDRDHSLLDLWYSQENLSGMLIMLDGREEDGGRKIFCSTCRDRVCADPSTNTGVGSPFENHARNHHSGQFGTYPGGAP